MLSPFMSKYGCLVEQRNYNIETHSFYSLATKQSKKQTEKQSMNLQMSSMLLQDPDDMPLKQYVAVKIYPRRRVEYYLITKPTTQISRHVTVDSF